MARASPQQRRMAAMPYPPYVTPPSGIATDCRMAALPYPAYESAAGKVGETHAPPDLDTLRLVLTPPLGEQYAGCDRNVEAFNVAGAFNGDAQIGARQPPVPGVVELIEGPLDLAFNRTALLLSNGGDQTLADVVRYTPLGEGQLKTWGLELLDAVIDRSHDRALARASSYFAWASVVCGTFPIAS